ncbi:MAG: tetratricopeptide repeat protein [Chloroflexota bacterium]
MNLSDHLKQAIQHRQNGNYTQAEAILTDLYQDYPDDPLINYHFAWTCDVQGKEREAVSYYEKAIANGLSDNDLRRALLGLGSTYRTLGDYENSRRILAMGIEKFPQANEFPVFLSITLYNLNEDKIAVQTLLKILLNTTSDDNILRFKRALALYAEDLDRIWDK